MTTNRREFIWLGAAGFAGAVQLQSSRRPIPAGAIEKALTAPVVRPELWAAPIPIASVELLEGAGDFLVRVRSRDGAEGIAVGHPDVLETTWPILARRVAPFFVGKDARHLDSLIDGVYLASSKPASGADTARARATCVP